MLNGMMSKRFAQAQPVAVTIDEGQALANLDGLQSRNPTLYALALVLRVSFFVALVVKSLMLLHW